MKKLLLGDEPKSVGLAEIGNVDKHWTGGAQCCCTDHEERDAKVPETETQFRQDL